MRKTKSQDKSVAWWGGEGEGGGDEYAIPSSAGKSKCYDTEDAAELSLKKISRVAAGADVAFVVLLGKAPFKW